MYFAITRRALLAATAILAISATGALAQDKILLRLSGVNSETDQRAIALINVFGPAVADFATFEPHWNGTLFQQGTELEAIAAGDLEMSITSAQELATFFPEWSVFAAGYVLQSAEHQVRVFNDPRGFSTIAERPTQPPEHQPIARPPLMAAAGSTRWSAPPHRWPAGSDRGRCRHPCTSPRRRGSRPWAGSP